MEDTDDIMIKCTGCFWHKGYWSNIFCLILGVPHQLQPWVRFNPRRLASHTMHAKDQMTPHYSTVFHWVHVQWWRFFASQHNFDLSCPQLLFDWCQTNRCLRYGLYSPQSQSVFLDHLLCLLIQCIKWNEFFILVKCRLVTFMELVGSYDNHELYLCIRYTMI